jgi:hypothetical protein
VVQAAKGQSGGRRPVQELHFASGATKQAAP